MNPLRGAPTWCAIATLAGLGVALLGPTFLRFPAVLLVAVPVAVMLYHLLRRRS
ncbi:MAG: hypothetical protein GAK28_03976 [Luteibacter sp.]|uniref:hypothetical protein n=1 Tax=Luteibacter sp. TaxID=1886636 RepID=UPI001381322A|nr:hypothetical protein [Luteibacter sp.]KAF1004454.1 MAG: hypothetical protein GAK28_03976 [Luteibacter sp.]